ncbi:MAG: hypothetical protein HYY06_00345 [Deltaproteobacteria bacterium]|nr:hypothetical protein [Deltaproteobacteria bacterium]
MFQDPPSPRRWPRSQQFKLSERGTAAESSYRSTIIASRTEEGRASYDSARLAWAESFHLQPDDGLYLGEVREGPIRMEQIVDALLTSGKSRKDAVSALERLFDEGMIFAIQR